MRNKLDRSTAEMQHFSGPGADDMRARPELQKPGDMRMFPHRADQCIRLERPHVDADRARDLGFESPSAVLFYLVADDVSAGGENLASRAPHVHFAARDLANHLL